MRYKRYGGPVLAGAAMLSAIVFLCIGPAAAEPTVDEIVPPLPVIVPTPSNWQPKFPWPFDQTRGSVTDADINAEREMCQWYNAQYDTLMGQVDNFDVNIVRSNGDY